MLHQRKSERFQSVINKQALPDHGGIFQCLFVLLKKMTINRIKSNLVRYALYNQKFSVKHV